MNFASPLLEKAFIWILWTAVSFHQIECIKHGRLIGFWPLNSKYGTQDISGNGNHGELHGNVRLSSGKKGEKGGAYRFLGNSTDDFIKIPNNGALDSNLAITMMLWYRPEGAQWGPLLSFEGPILYTGVVLWATQDGIYFRVCNPYMMVSTSRSLQHLAVTYDRSIAKAALYINGSLQQEKNIACQMSTQHPIYMGNYQPSNGDARCLKGEVSCAKIYNAALSQQEITSAMSQCSQDSSIEGMWTLRHDGSRLSGHVTASKIVHSRLECALACKGTGTCRSVNFNTSSLNGEFTCELNSEDEAGLGITLTKAIGMEYWDED